MDMPGGIPASAGGIWSIPCAAAAIAMTTPHRAFLRLAQARADRALTSVKYLLFL